MDRQPLTCYSISAHPTYLGRYLEYDYGGRQTLLFRLTAASALVRFLALTLGYSFLGKMGKLVIERECHPKPIYTATEKE